METIENIRKKYETMALFDIQGGDSPVLKMVEVGKANRMNTPEQATMLTTLRLFFRGMGFEDWGEEFCDSIEDYQTTCGIPREETNSRIMLQEVLEWQKALEAQSGRPTFNLFNEGSKK